MGLTIKVDETERGSEVLRMVMMRT